MATTSFDQQVDTLDHSDADHDFPALESESSSGGFLLGMPEMGTKAELLDAEWLESSPGRSFNPLSLNPDIGSSLEILDSEGLSVRVGNDPFTIDLHPFQSVEDVSIIENSGVSTVPVVVPPTPEEDVSAAFGTLIQSDDSSTNTTVTTAGTPVAAAGTQKVGADILLFDLSGGGLRYIGLPTRKFEIKCSATLARISGGSPMLAKLLIRLNGSDIVVDTPDVLLAQTATCINAAGQDRDNVSMTYIMELQQNDILRWYIDSDTDADVVSLEDGATLTAIALS